MKKKNYSLCPTYEKLLKSTESQEHIHIQHVFQLDLHEGYIFTEAAAKKKYVKTTKLRLFSA